MPDTVSRPSRAHYAGPSPDDLADRAEDVVAEMSRRLLACQRPDGHWLFPLEADVTIPAEYILLLHYLDDRDPALERRLAVFLRDRQSDDHGGWPLFHGGAFDISASVKAYLALKLVGDDPDAPHMARARAAIRAHGGAETANVFTRYTLALFGAIPWAGVPVMPVELALLPRRSAIGMARFSYWSRTVIAPLLVLAALKPRARNPTGTTLGELFVTPPEQIRRWQKNPTGHWIGDAMIALDGVLRQVEPHVPRRLRRRAVDRATAFFTERLNGEDGLGAIYPAMANAVMALDALGVPADDPQLSVARAALRRLITEVDGMVYVQPCLSPIWDTCLSLHALMEAGIPGDDGRLTQAFDWLRERQITEAPGDWQWQAPAGLAGGGWAFQYRNDHYPDVDDTAVVGMAFHRATGDRDDPAVARAATWIEGMQSRNGGWGAFDVDNDTAWLNHIPFADHGALLDPPTVDVSARCLSFLLQAGHPADHPAIRRGLAFLRAEQEADGSWFGRWGTNYIYGTWSALAAFNAAGIGPEDPTIRRGVEWLMAHQGPDGGWGEDGASYWAEARGLCKGSTPSQTAWALLGLMAGGAVESAAVRRGIAWLLDAPREADGPRWEEPWFTAVGFPRVFYLRYHGYSAYFPIWALARYADLARRGRARPAHGM